MTAKRSHSGELQTFSITSSSLCSATGAYLFQQRFTGRWTVIILKQLFLKSSAIGWTVHVLFK